MTIGTVVIAGAGHAGFQAAASLRQEGFDGRILLVDGETALPYQRPPLSKAYLKGDMALEAMSFRRPPFFDEHRIERVNACATAIDRVGCRLLLANGESVPYDHLVLALGARNRTLSVPGSEGPGVMGIRTLQDADLLRESLAKSHRAAVIGAGFIGLEFAAVALAKGLEVHVVEQAALPMERALSSVMAGFFLDHHRNSGVQFHAGCGVRKVVRGPDNSVTAIDLTNGHQLMVDLVVFGIGVLPNSVLAKNAGLPCSNGIDVDERLLTDDPHISAIGDAANVLGSDGARLRIESVQNATDQARYVAARIVKQTPVPYKAVPWFWSDQGSLRLQIAGLSNGHDHVHVLGNRENARFSTLCFRGGRLVCVESVNSAADHMAARRILASDAPPSLDQVLAPGFALKGWVAGNPPPSDAAAPV